MKNKTEKLAEQILRQMERLGKLEDKINELRRKGLFPGNPGDEINIGTYQTNQFQTNPDVNIADVGAMVNEALFAFEDGDIDATRDNLLTIHSMLYPDASRPATPAENATLTAQEPDPCDSKHVRLTKLQDSYEEACSTLSPEQKLNRIKALAARNFTPTLFTILVLLTLE